MTLNNRVSKLEKLVKPVLPEINPPLDDSLPSHWYERVKRKMAKGDYVPNMSIERFHEIRNAMLLADDC